MLSQKCYDSGLIIDSEKFYPEKADRWILCGGGAKNSFLVIVLNSAFECALSNKVKIAILVKIFIVFIIISMP